jgi:hypothetical protein
MVVEGEQAKPILQGVRANQKVGEDASRTGVSLFPAAAGVELESLTRRAPDRLAQLPVDRNTRLLAKRIEKGLSP